MNVRNSVMLCAVFAAGGLCAERSYPAGTLYFFVNDYSGPPVVDAPFCGEQHSARTVTQSDGAQRTEEVGLEKICRDSAGRTRYEYPIHLGGRQVGPLFVEIYDPVAHAKYIFYAVNKTVYRQELPARRAQHPPVGAAVPAGSDLVGEVENLGAQTMEGLLVEGRRFARQVPAGQERNKTSFTRTFEDWWAPELGESLLDKSSDPVKGELVHKLIDITRAEPDPDLFRLPPDYAVVNETRDFTILWGSDRGAEPVETSGH